MASKRKRSRKRAGTTQRAEPASRLSAEASAAALESAPSVSLRLPDLSATPLVRSGVAIPAFLVLLALVPILLAEGFTGGWLVNQDLLHYAAVGLSLATGEGMHFPDGETPFTVHGPVLPLLLGFLWAVFGFSFDVMVWGMRLFGAAGLVCAFFLGKKLSGTLGGFVFGLLMAVSPVYASNIFFTRFIDALGMTFIVCGTLAAVHAFERRNLCLAAGAGGLLALACLTKETFILMLVVPLLLSAAVRPLGQDQGRLRLDAAYWRTLAVMLAPLFALYGAWVLVVRQWAGQDVTHTDLPFGTVLAVVAGALIVLGLVAVRPPSLLSRVPPLALQAVVFIGALLIAAAGLSAVGFTEGEGGLGALISYLNGIDEHVLPFPVMVAGVAIVAVHAWSRRDRVALALLLSLAAAMPVAVHAARLDLGYRQLMGPATLTFLICGLAVVIATGWLRRLPVWGSRTGSEATGPTQLVFAGLLLLLAVPVLNDSRSYYDTVAGRYALALPAPRSWLEENVREGSHILIRPTLGAMLYLETEGAYTMHWFPEQTLIFDADEPSGFRPAASTFGLDTGTFGPEHYERGDRLVALSGGHDGGRFGGISDALLYEVLSESGATVAIDYAGRHAFLEALPGVEVLADVGVFRVLSIDQAELRPVEGLPLYLSESTLRTLERESGWDRETLLARIAPDGAKIETQGGVAP